MFYSVQIMCKGGPLQVIWLAAHMDRQLKRQQVFDTSIPFTVDTIIKPQGPPDNEVPLALRLSGQLLLGVVKVYARKVAYLAQDCDDTLNKLGTVEHPRQEPSGDQPAGVTTGATSHAAEKRGKRASAAKPSGFAPSLDLNGEDWPESDEELFGTPSAAANAAMTSTLGSQPLLLSSLSMRPGDSATHTPAAVRRLLADAETPMAAAVRTLSLTASLPQIDLEEMFEPVPEHFEFDLEDFEVDVLATAEAGVPVPNSQQMSNLDTQPLLVPVPENPEEEERHMTETGDGSGPSKSGGASFRSAAAEGDTLLKAGGAGDEDAYEFARDVGDGGAGEGDAGVPEDEAMMGSPDQQATVQYEAGPSSTVPPGTGGEADIAALGSQTGAVAVAPAAVAADAGGGEKRLTRAARAAAAAAAVGVAQQATAPAGPKGKRGAAEAELPDQAATGKGARRAAAAAAGERGAAAGAGSVRGKGRAASPARQVKQRKERGSLAVARAKIALDAAGTTMSNAAYRAYLIDRSALLRPQALSRIKARQGASAPRAPSRARAPQTQKPPHRGLNGKAAAAAAAAGGSDPDLQLLFGLPLWTHAALRSLYAQALGASKGGVPVDLVALLQRNQAVVSGGALGGLMPALALSDDEDGEGEGEKPGPGKKQKLLGSRKGQEGQEGREGQDQEASEEGQEAGPSGLAAGEGAHEEAQHGGEGMLLDATNPSHSNEEADQSGAPPGFDADTQVDGVPEDREDGEEEEEEEDPYQGDAVNVFEESRRMADEEEEAQAAADGDEAVRSGGAARDTGLTSRTRALLRQVEQAVKRQQGGTQVTKRQRGEEPNAGGDVQGQGQSADDAEQAGMDTQGSGAVLMSQLLPEDRSDKRRSTAASASAAPKLRHRAAQTFYDLLVLQNRGLVQLQQPRPYQDLVVVPLARGA